MEIRGHRNGWFAFGAVALLLAVACTTSPATAGSASTTSAGSRSIPQPDVSGLDVAPDAARVDLRVPTFSHPTDITNPLFPVSDQASVLMLGQVEGNRSGPR